MKEKKGIITHVAIIAVILIILIVSVYKLVKWNQGSADAGAVETDEDFDTEPEDYIAALDSALLKGHEDDGVTSIVFLGDDVLANYQGKDGIPEQTAALMGADKVNVYNIGFSGMYQSTASTVWDEAHSEDAFSLYWIAKCIALNDYSLLHNTLPDLPNADSQFDTTIKTLEGIDFNKVDVITMMYGVNDYLNGRLITNTADMNDIASYSGALKSSIEVIQKAYPHIRIVVMSPTFCLLEQDGKLVNCDVANTGYGILADYMVAEKAIAVDTNVTFLDNYFGVKINANTYKEYMEDNVHPNEAGRKMIANRVATVLTKENAAAKEK